MKEFFVRVWKNCSDPKSYAEIIDQPFSNSLGLITFLIILFSLFFSFFFNLGALDLINKAVNWIDRNVPALEIKNGVVSSTVKQPYLKNFEGFLFAIDTTGKTSKIDDKCGTGILVTRDRVHFLRDKSKTEVYDIPASVKEFYLDADIINKWINIGKYFILPAIFFFLFTFTWIAVLMKIFFYSLISLLFNAVFSAKLGYGALLNIGAHALTLPFLASILIEFAGIPLPWLVYNHLVYILLLGAVIYKLRRAGTK